MRWRACRAGPTRSPRRTGSAIGLGDRRRTCPRWAYVEQGRGNRAAARKRGDPAAVVMTAHRRGARGRFSAEIGVDVRSRARSAWARGAAVGAADAGAAAGGAAARREFCASGGGDLPATGRARAGQHEALRVQQPERLGDQIAAAMPRAAAQGGDLAGADGLALMRVLGISERAQHGPLLTGHAPNASGPLGCGAASPRTCAQPAVALQDPHRGLIDERAGARRVGGAASAPAVGPPSRDAGIAPLGGS